MGWVEDLGGQLVGLDTAPLIYFMERHPYYHPRVAPFFVALEQRQLRRVASTLCLTEVLVQPLARKDAALAARYRRILLGQRVVDLAEVTADIVSEAARLRADFGLRTPDAVHLATALLAGATTFLTNDGRLARVPGLQVLILDQLVP